MKNVFYFRNINSIGGVESFFWYLANKYQDWDITIVYRDGDQAQLNRLSKIVRVKRFKSGERIQCEKAFFNYACDIIDSVDAEEYIQIIHADYKAQGISPNIHPKITRLIGVSKHVCRTFAEVSGREPELVYNPVAIKKPKKILHLISATRLTMEKGKARIIKLAEALEAKEIPYRWELFTDDRNMIEKKGIIYRRPKLDIIDDIADSDYLVQLSDSEAFCYSVVEALSVGTPVIVTDCPVFKEIGVKDGVNGFVLDFDMDNIPVDKIYKGLRKKFVYEPVPDGWSEILAPGESQYKKDLATVVEIEITKEYYDMLLGHIVKPGEEIKMNKVRGDIVVDAGYGKYTEERNENS